MIEIDRAPLKQHEKLRAQKSLRAAGLKGGLTGTTFDELLDIEISSNIEDALADLKDQEKRFLDAQSFYELQKYRKLVQSILKLIMSEGFEVETIKRPRKENKANILLVNCINEKILLLTKAVTEHNKAFDLLKTIEEIRGLLLDLVY